MKDGDSLHRYGSAFTSASGDRMVAGTAFARILRRITRWHYFQYIGKYALPAGRVLEFGCGGGNKWLGASYDVTGLEYSFAASTGASRLYSKCLVGDVSSIPLADRSFSCVCSSFVLEHLPAEVATPALREIRRVLKPGGVFVSLLDLECEHPFMRHLLRRYPSVYSAAMIDVPSHRGLVTEAVWEERVKAAGFKVKEWKLETRIPTLDLATYAYLAVVPSAPLLLRKLGQVCDFLAKSRIFSALYSIGITLADDMIRTILPERWAYRLLFVLERAE